MTNIIRTAIISIADIAHREKRGKQITLSKCGYLYKNLNTFSFCRKPLRVVAVVAVLIFVISNLACAVVAREHQKEYSSIPMYLLYVRVAINESLFVIFAIALSVCIFRMTKMSSSSLVLEAKVRINPPPGLVY